MPRLTASLPKHRKHKASGKAVVALDGQDFYLGPYGSRASRREYDRLVGEWQHNGRRLPADPQCVTVAEVINGYRKFSESYYRKNGQVTREFGCIKEAMKIVRQLYGDTQASDFGPLALKAVRQRMIETGWSRGYINKSVGRIRRCFRWAVENELVPPESHHGLMAVLGLRKGRTKARETALVPPVSDDIVDATLPYLPAVVADMVRFERLTGCRPREVCIVRPCDVDTSGASNADTSLTCVPCRCTGEVAWPPDRGGSSSACLAVESVGSEYTRSPVR